MTTSPHAAFSTPYSELKARAITLRQNQTPAEAVFWSRVDRSKLGIRCRRSVVRYGYIVDFYFPKWNLIVEIDGAAHAHRGAADAWRDDWLLNCGYRIMRFPNQRVLDDIKGVIKAVVSFGRDGIVLPRNLGLVPVPRKVVPVGLSLLDVINNRDPAALLPRQPSIPLPVRSQRRVEQKL